MNQERASEEPEDARSSRQHDATPSEQAADPSALSALVKSRILDRVLRDLAEDAALGLRRSRYTKSAGGVYGKYEKFDADGEQLLAQVREQLERIVADERLRDGE